MIRTQFASCHSIESALWVNFTNRSAQNYKFLTQILAGQKNAIIFNNDKLINFRTQLNVTIVQILHTHIGLIRIDRFVKNLQNGIETYFTFKHNFVLKLSLHCIFLHMYLESISSVHFLREYSTEATYNNC
jgi:ethanolamine utilization cobalamin adenosyltransferase